MLIDTHSHIFIEEFDGDTSAAISRAVANGVHKIILPNIDSSTIKRLIDTSNSHPGICYPLIGLHPTSVKENYIEELELVENWLNRYRFYGIGEIGIDLYWDETFKKEQEFVFTRQINIANNLGLPVSIHTRNSFEVAFNIIKKEKLSKLTGVFHCFSGTVEEAKAVIKAGFKIGVGGTVTFKNSGIDKIIAQLSPQDILLETDSPYLAPVPFRGKQNESAYLKYIAEKVAQIFDLPLEEIETISTQNALQIFKL
ncbi:MAG TPA: TatD family hydrolase [Prolixibacteraceae bacterium]|nr:TatD family hydrolase [Prolixibacteraceae bacterium]